MDALFILSWRLLIKCMSSIYCIGVDIGTGSTKALAIGLSGNVLFSSSATYPTLHPYPGYSEQVPETIWQAFIKCITEVIQHMKEPPACVALSSAMHSLIPVDENGEPLLNMITWADNRSAAIAERIKKSSLGEMIYEQTGTPIHPMAPLSKILWLKENEQHVFKRTHKFISIKEFIWFKLFGVFEIDQSIASATGLFDLEKRKWNENSLALAGIGSDKLSLPVTTDHERTNIIPATAEAYGLSQQLKFIIGASDGCMANLGSFAVDPGIAALTIGTSGAIRVGSHKPLHNFEAMTFNYILDETTFISGGPINNGGVILKWYAESLLQKKLITPADYDTLLKELDLTNAGADGLIFLPYLLGERAPIWNSEASGVFFGITAQHSQAHFTRAVIEGITMALYDVATALEKTGLLIEQVNASGGFVHSDAWMQILADIFNKKICLVNSDDASAIGAAYLAMKTLGLIPSYDSVRTPYKKEFKPNAANHAIHAKKFARYRKLYNSLKEEMGD